MIRNLVIAFSTIVMFPVMTQADSFTLEYNVEFSGATAPAGSTPWITATFNDGGSPGSVQLTMATANLVSTEFITEWYFNLDPAFDPNELVFVPVNTTVATTNSISPAANDVDEYKADGDGLYDILFDFPPPPGNFSNKFTAGETVIYNITSTENIVAGSFVNFFSTPDGGNGPFLAAAKVQGIGSEGEDSGWVAPVPEPTTITLLGIGLAGLAWRGVRRRLKGERK